MNPEQEELASPSKKVPAVLIGVGIAVLLLGALLMWRALSRTNHIALAEQPKGVTVMQAKETQYRPLRRYVGAIEPWVSARVGPQLVSAYVDTVLVRPGDRVKRGQVLATLDCRNSSALARSIQMQAKAVESTQAALAKESERVQSLLDGGFVSPNEVEQKNAESASKESQLLGLKAQMLGTDLQVSDCILRAPFDGEIGEREADPGAFAKPGMAIVTVVDRAMLRVTADVPESDFVAVAPDNEVRIRVLATGQELTARISRRSPEADSGTRTIHMEIDLQNRDRSIPAGTTADLRIEAGRAEPALEVPLSTATVRGDKAVLMTVKDGVAHQTTVRLIGEREGLLYLDPSLGKGAEVVSEGRAALSEGDPVLARAAAPAPTETARAVVNDGGRPRGQPRATGESQKAARP